MKLCISLPGMCPSNADFYVTAATVIPVLYVALTLQGRTFHDILTALGCGPCHEYVAPVRLPVVCRALVGRLISDRPATRLTARHVAMPEMACLCRRAVAGHPADLGVTV
jgi:hypothetical protein